MTTSRTDSVLELDARLLAALDSSLRREASRVGLAARRAATPSEAADLGRLAEALDTAHDAVFNVLNIATCYCNDAYAGAAIGDEREARIEGRA